ncbi:16S rRNA (cytosine(1402)-N(4))-methyltransferase RsmH [Caulobacter sp. S45]|uniref:16S rRNA (cytosine(1402)-N(4))-methyltransferase RsmH n=1 Tax=Caulobacter sp. S45 TaxID=1641861 RepID=UPI00131A99FB|nr:16S rRNA (cytosine(1402)-N(4))-methyltransferase RsmH [Caulobacter sp. S45]
MTERPHLPVMLAEVVEAIAPRPDAVIVDATFGAGGYTTAFLEAGARVVALDRDPNAERFAGPLSATYGERFRLIRRPFSELQEALAEAGVAHCDGLAFDLGVSSMQLDEAERGFSFMRDGPLDMRMAQDGPTAADLVNTAEADELVRILRRYGEEPAARRIAKTLVLRRETQPFLRTADLADTVETALGGRRGAPTHPATRTFQALRIAVNDELGELEAGLEAAERVLAPDGRLAVVTFHSLEDRIVKAFMIERGGRTPLGSRHLPPTAAGPAPSFHLLFNGAWAAGESEVALNPRARSAKLRAAARTEAPAWKAAA